jgi:threonine dehydratase
VDDIVLVDEGDIEQPIVMLLEIEKTLVEGAGAAGLAALIKDKARFAGTRGAGAGRRQHRSAAAGGDHRARHGARRAAGPHARQRARRAGLAGRITATVAEAGANVNEVHHQRAFTMLAAQNVDIELVIQTRGPAHLASVLVALKDAGFEAEEQH